MNVKKALRLYNFLMMKRHDNLQGLITEFTSSSNYLDKMRKKNKTTAIAGGTTGAVGGVTAVLGIALAPVTLGASLIVTAVGAGMVASAGGMGVHATKMANKKIVNRMAVEKLVYEYKSNIIDIEYCLDFILSGMTELRRHDVARLQRAGAEADVLKVAHLSQFVLKNYTDRKSSVANSAGMSSERLLQVFSKELDQYFTDKDDQKLKKSKRSRFSGSVRMLAENLQVELDYLSQMWEMLS
ncbi:apolipoprotein L domain-containing protein 1-like [Brachionichthys hirsutus]|uniref:apolipoprotein L domain-containing protein 1-like n=1 Tax=Brachionichthys hirsutus TaxID=412623 RepID=UPI00360451A4